MAILSETDRQKVNDASDGRFYDRPRLVTHADDGFLARLTELYDAELDPGDRALDLMSSHVSHLPDRAFARVVGHGMNERELAANDRLDEFFVRDLNADPGLPLTDDSVDAVLCALSVQYLQYPEAVFRAVGRVLAPGGVVVVSFTDRMFPTKAVRAWREATMDGRADLVAEYVRAAGATEVRVVGERPARDPFYAVVGRRG